MDHDRFEAVNATPVSCNPGGSHSDDCAIVAVTFVTLKWPLVIQASQRSLVQAECCLAVCLDCNRQLEASAVILRDLDKVISKSQK